jgi:hypothetical protein
MEIEVRLSLVDLKCAFRRLSARLPDESEAGADFIVFKADADHLEIVSGGTSETLRASVVYPGEALVPCPVFRGIARTLQFYRGRAVSIVSSKAFSVSAALSFAIRTFPSRSKRATRLDGRGLICCCDFVADFAGLCLILQSQVLYLLRPQSVQKGS